jgi:hygromycin-B 7''-O-kinase
MYTQRVLAGGTAGKHSLHIPWPYPIDPTSTIFGWSFVLMPRMPGLQLADPQVKKQLEPADKLGIAQAPGENLAQMQQVTWPFAGRYNAANDTVEPFQLAHELAWPFPIDSDAQLASIEPTIITYSEKVKRSLRHHLIQAQQYNARATTPEDISWVEELIMEAQDALDEPFEPCLLMEDYKEESRCHTARQAMAGQWHVRPDGSSFW